MNSDLEMMASRQLELGERTVIAAEKVADMQREFIGAILQVAIAINRLAATQEHPKPKGAVSFSTASYDNQPDPQTAQLREIAKKRSEGDNS